MVYRGRVQNGVVVLDEPDALPEGSVVNVEVAEAPEDIKSLREGLLSLAGIVEGPPDLARNHDYYAHGQAKK